AHRHQQPQAQGAGGHPRADQRDECYFYRTTAALKNPIRIYPQLIENIRAWPIHKVYEDREGLIETVDRLTLQHILDKHGERIGDLISRVSYLELIRLKESPWKVDPPNETQFWKKMRADVTAHEQL